MPIPQITVLGIDLLGIKFWVFTQLIISLFADLSGSYGYNMVVFSVLLFAYYSRPNPEPLMTAMILLLLSILLDVVNLGIYATDIINTPAVNSQIGTFKFCLGMTILNLLLKPVTLWISHMEFKQMGGEYTVSRGGGDPRPYQVVPSSAPEDNGGGGSTGGYHNAAPGSYTGVPYAPPEIKSSGGPNAGSAGGPPSYQSGGRDAAPF